MMNKKALNGAFNLTKMLFIIVIAALSLVFAFFIFSGIQEIHDYVTPYTYHYEANDYQYYLRNHDYGDIMRTARKDRTAANDKSSDVREIRAIGQYWETEALLNAYEMTGNSEAADLMREKMENLRAQVTNYSDHLAEVDRLLAAGKNE